jgi:O-antigen ligase
MNASTTTWPGSAALSAGDGLLFARVQKHWFQLLIALLWGTITGFAMASEMYGPMIQGCGLIVAWLLSLLSSGCMALLAWTRNRAGLLLAAHAAVAAASGFLSDSEIQDILRYIALLPALSMLLAVVQKGPQAVTAFRVGLTWAGIIFVIFHLFFLEPDALLDPSQRLTVFLNTNGIGFIAAMTAVSALALAWDARTRKKRIFWGVVVFLSAIIWLSTKSRTAFLALMGGCLTIALLRYRVIEVLRLQFSKRPFLICVILLIGLGFAISHKGFVVNVLSLDDDYRSVESGTGRYEIWQYLLGDVFPQAPWFGVGPGNHGDLVLDATGSTSAHNGILMALAETGVFGLIPLLLLIGLCFVKIAKCWRDPSVTWAAALFIAGLAESSGEIMLFSIGSPGSLMFMVAVATLASHSPAVAAAQHIAGSPSGADGPLPRKSGLENDVLNVDFGHPAREKARPRGETVRLLNGFEGRRRL